MAKYTHFNHPTSFTLYIGYSNKAKKYYVGYQFKLENLKSGSIIVEMFLADIFTKDKIVA